MMSATTRLLLALFAPLRVTLVRVTLVRVTLFMVTLAMVTLAMGTWSLPAAAQPPGVDEEAGRELATDAMVAYNTGDYGSALASFNQAREVYPTGQVLRMTGYTLFALENWVEAANTLDEAIKTEFKPLSEDDAEHARSQLAEALTHIASVTVNSSIDGATLTVDDGAAEELPATVRIDPGSHSFVVSAPGHDDLYRQEELEAGQELTFTMDPSPLGEGDSPPPPRPKPDPDPEPDEGDGSMGWFAGQGTVGLITAGVGVAVGAVGVVGLIYGGNLRSAVQENIDAHQANYDPGCNTNTELCQYDIAMINEDGERAQTWQDTGVVMTITGGALLVTGVTLWLFAGDGPLADDDADQASWSCLPGLTGTGASEGSVPSGVAVGCFGSF
ncbi:MAG: PEGA domain-containing protein [Deltaproteobacteria bacterium]|nr:PEGA domain-containing protein [Deltaproteobacteria bacterium]